MGLMKKLHDAFESKDVKAMDQLMADDFIFVRHQVEHKSLSRRC